MALPLKGGDASMGRRFRERASVVECGGKRKRDTAFVSRSTR